MTLRIGCSALYVQSTYSKFRRNVCVRFPSLKELLEYVCWSSSVNFEGIEVPVLTERQLSTVFEGNTERIRRTCSDFNVEVAQLSLGHYIAFPERILEKRVTSRALEVFKRVTQIAKELGTDTINLTSPSLPGVQAIWSRIYEHGPPDALYLKDGFDWNKTWEYYVQIMGEAVDIAKESGLRIAVEARTRELISGSDGALRLIDEVGSIGVVMDTGHLFIQKEVLPFSIHKLGKHIFVVHLSDNDGVTEYHWPPGDGKIDWHGVLTALAQIGYRGYLNIDAGGLKGRKDCSDAYRRGKEYISGILSEI